MLDVVPPCVKQTRRSTPMFHRHVAVLASAPSWRRSSAPQQSGAVPFGTVNNLTFSHAFTLPGVTLPAGDLRVQSGPTDSNIVRRLVEEPGKTLLPTGPDRGRASDGTQRRRHIRRSSNRDAETDAGVDRIGHESGSQVPISVVLQVRGTRVIPACAAPSGVTIRRSNIASR